MKRSVRFNSSIALIATAILLSGCDNPFAWLFSVSSAPVPKQFPAAFETVAEASYTFDSDAALPLSVPQTDALAQVLKGAGFTQISRRIDGQASANNFLEYNASIDAEFFSGHGSFGLADFIDESFFGPGNNGTSYEPGFPIQGRLKWIFFDSSDTVAGPYYIDPQDPNASYYSSNWLPAFGGSLHGVYGFWQGTGSCSSQKQIGPEPRACDVTDPNNALELFGNYATPHGGSKVHDAWVSAAIFSGFDSGWAIYEDGSASNDRLSSPGDGSAPPAYT